MPVDPDQYDVIIADPAKIYPLGGDDPVRGTVLIVAIATNTGRPRFGVTSRLASTPNGAVLSREDKVALDHPKGIRLGRYAITGGSVGDGVTVIHGGTTE